MITLIRGVRPQFEPMSRRLTKFSAWALVGVATILALLGNAAKADDPPGRPGPFAGTMLHGESAEHNYENNPLAGPCAQVQVNYRVRLDYRPEADVLTLAVGETEVPGANGSAELLLTAPACTSFPIKVRGTDVALAALYVVRVSSETGS